MIKKFLAWVKALFAPAKIDDVKVDEYIAKQKADRQPTIDPKTVKVYLDGQEIKGFDDEVETVNRVRFTKAEERPMEQPVGEGEAIVGFDPDKNTIKVVKVETETYTRPKAPPTPPKPLDEQLKGVELPTYAKGKTLPPKAKRQFIKQAKTSGSPASARRLDDTPHSTGGHVASHGIDPVNAALYGYAAGAILSDDTPSSPAPAPVEECRSSAATSTYSSSYSSSDDSYSSSSYSSSSSSYDSSSYDSGSSSSSCD